MSNVRRPKLPIVDILLTVVSIAIIPVGIIAILKVQAHWHYVDSLKRDAASWNYLRWQTPELIKLREQLVPSTLPGNKGNAEALRQIEAIDAVLRIRNTSA